MLPRVVLFDAVSLDGRIEGFAPDIGRFYEIVMRSPEDVTLAGADTMLAGGSQIPLDDPAAPVPTPPGGTAPLIAITDSGGRFRSWDWLRAQPYWRDAVALVSEATPAEYLAHLEARGVRYLCSGAERVDLRAALEWFASEHGAGVVRVESGGTLNTALLLEGLVDELWLLVHPALAGESARSFVRGAMPKAIALRLVHSEALESGLVWLRYEVVHEDA